MAPWDNQKLVITYKSEVTGSTPGSSYFSLVFINNLKTITIYDLLFNIYINI